MGCRDRHSNFNNLHYHDGKWWCSWGWDFTVTAPTSELIKEYLGEHIVKYILTFDAEQDTWTARPIEKPQLID
jgi:hypothetical protein